MREIYLDNAATTQCDPMVLKAIAPFWSKDYGNPSSFNDSGRKAEETVGQSRRKIARILGAKDQEIVFTSSATEANNLAIQGIASNFRLKPKTKNPKPHIITTQIEHQSILEPIKHLEKEGFSVTYLSVSKQGLISLEGFKKAIQPETFLISIIYAHNEIGAIQPIKKIAKIIKELENPPYFHIDAAQAASLDLNVNNLGVDLMTLSSHKIHGPKGIAALYVRQETKIEPIILGGGQERGLRSGTEAVPLAVGFGKTLELIQKSRK